MTQWVDFHQTCIDTLFGEEKELDFSMSPQDFVISTL